ncbi:MAG: histidine phosphatase family protein [Roseovarius sp.]|nr:histidine phosphatase family protein [Roseovarius sp.]MCY4290919.1 histidine phosphatase family protein [Roseovarius sp.]
MHRLILVRHAKSSWDSPHDHDHERPLNKRGRRSAKAIGDWLRSRNHVPDMAYVSSSVRTRETFERLEFKCDVAHSIDLYHAGGNEMMHILKNATGGTVLMIGHNPGIGWFAEKLLDKPPRHARFYDYPTCATLIAEFEIDCWRNVEIGSGGVIDFIVPRELTD